MTDFAQRLATLRSEPSRDDTLDPARRARVERTRTEMMRQGVAITRTLAQEDGAIEALAAAIVRRGCRRVAVVGCGDSWFVGMAVRHAWETLTGLPLEAAQALDYAAYGSVTADAETLVIGLSAGGNTPAVLAALAAARAKGALIVGVSSTAGSPVLQDYDAGLVVHATRSGWPTQSTTAAIALLMRLSGAVAERQGRDPTTFMASLAAIPAQMDAVAAALDAPVAGMARLVAAAPLVLFAGLGPNFATAALGAAKIRELSPVHAMAFPLEEMHHYRLPKQGDPVLIIATDPPSRERALDTALVSRAVGARAIVMLTGPDAEMQSIAADVMRVPPVPAALMPLIAAVPLHLFTYHFATARFEAASLDQTA